jgi:hypothetical protein
MYIEIGDLDMMRVFEEQLAGERQMDDLGMADAKCF